MNQITTVLLVLSMQLNRPSFVIDTAIAEHFEVLRFVPFARSGVVEAVAPCGGRIGSIAGNLDSESLASYAINPAYGWSGIGSTSRGRLFDAGGLPLEVVMVGPS